MSNPSNNGKLILSSDYITTHRPIQLVRLDDYPEKGESSYFYCRQALVKDIMQEVEASSNVDKLKTTCDQVVKCAVNEDGSPMFNDETILLVPSSLLLAMYQAIHRGNYGEAEEQKKE